MTCLRAGMYHVRFASLGVSLLVGSLSAQAPSFTIFGTPCAIDPPPLSALSQPRIGQPFQLQARSGGSTGVPYEGGMAAAVVAGFSRTSWLGVPLPWTPATMGSLLPGVGSCGDLEIAADMPMFLPFQMPRGPVTLTISIPNDLGLVGLHLYFQPVDYRGNLTHQTLGLYLGSAAEAIVGV
ncbi:MAG: hypothetical protein KDC98_18225 [Planctomycetes bacterium]|nr:hypothetical protein [Planctomycetota bacterium]